MTTVTPDKIEQVLSTLEARVTDLQTTQEREQQERIDTERKMKEVACRLADANSIGYQLDDMLAELGWGNRLRSINTRMRLELEQRATDPWTLQHQGRGVVAQLTGWEASQPPVIRWTVRCAALTMTDSDECVCLAEPTPLADVPEPLREQIIGRYEALQPGARDADTLTTIVHPTSCASSSCRNA